jgi:hypothetical protein
LAGLDLVDLRTELGIEMIKSLRHAVYAGTEVGKMILINLGHSQQEAGIGLLLFENPDLYVPYYMTKTWLMSVRQYMSQRNIKITFTEQYGLKLKSQHDQFIVDQPALKGFSDDDQLDINLVRIHVRANTLAELTEPKGNRIRETAYNGQRNEHHSPDTQWPRQPEPTPYQV